MHLDTSLMCLYIHTHISLDSWQYASCQREPELQWIIRIPRPYTVWTRVSNTVDSIEASGERRRKKNVVLVRADPGASAFSASRLGTAPTKRGHLDMHGPVVSRCSSCAVPGANTTRGDPRALPARGPDAENSAKHARTGCAALPPRDDALHAPHMLVLGGAWPIGDGNDDDCALARWPTGICCALAVLALPIADGWLAAWPSTAGNPRRLSSWHGKAPAPRQHVAPATPLG
jgi:hypothetical protein